MEVRSWDVGCKHEHLFATSYAFLGLRKAGAIDNTNSNFTRIRDGDFATIGDEYHLNSRNVLFLTVTVLPNRASIISGIKTRRVFWLAGKPPPPPPPLFFSFLSLDFLCVELLIVYKPVFYVHTEICLAGERRRISSVASLRRREATAGNTSVFTGYVTCSFWYNNDERLRSLNKTW